jgi:hypothetical protein
VRVVRASSLAVLLVAALAAGGCGGSTPTPEQEVRDTIEAYNSAIAAGDGKRACGYLTPEGVRQVSRKHPEGRLAACSENLAGQHKAPGFEQAASDFRITEVAVHGNEAQVRATTEPKAGSNINFRLLKQAGAWKIDLILSSS